MYRKGYKKRRKLGWVRMAKQSWYYFKQVFWIAKNLI